MNFTGVNLDLQGLMKRTYANLLYNSQFYKMLNRRFFEIGRTGTPIIEVVKQLDTKLKVELNRKLLIAMRSEFTCKRSAKTLADFPESAFK